jgi:hypothetical protein
MALDVIARGGVEEGVGNDAAGVEDAGCVTTCGNTQTPLARCAVLP